MLFAHEKYPLSKTIEDQNFQSKSFGRSPEKVKLMRSQTRNYFPKLLDQKKVYQVKRHLVITTNYLDATSWNLIRCESTRIFMTKI